MRVRLDGGQVAGVRNHARYAAAAAVGGCTAGVRQDRATLMLACDGAAA